MGSLREQFLQAADLRRDTVDCPEWGGVVTVRELTGPQRDQHQINQFRFDSETGKPSLSPKLDNALLVCWAVIDPDTGERIFSDDDLPELRKKSGRVLDRIGSKVLELTGMGGAEKNSETTPGSSPSTTSPSPSGTPTPSA